MINRPFTLILILVIPLITGCGLLLEKPENELSFSDIRFDLSSYVEDEMIFEVRATGAPAPVFKPSWIAQGREFFTIDISDGEDTAKAFLNFRSRANDLTKLKESKITILATIFQHPTDEVMEIYIKAYAHGWGISESWNSDMKNKFLDHAVTRNKLDLAEHLLEVGADANYVREGDEFIPMVIIASQLKYYDMLRLLHKHGADIDAPDHIGLSALHRAAQFDRATAVDVLLQLGANIEIRDSKLGGTPLHRAAYSKSINAAAFLIGLGAEINAKTTGGGLTALELARAAGGSAGKDVVNLLITHGAK